MVAKSISHRSETLVSDSTPQLNCQQTMICTMKPWNVIFLRKYQQAPWFPLHGTSFRCDFYGHLAHPPYGGGSKRWNPQALHSEPRPYGPERLSARDAALHGVHEAHHGVGGHGELLGDG